MDSEWVNVVETAVGVSFERPAGWLMEYDPMGVVSLLPPAALETMDMLPRIDILSLPAEGLTLDQFTDERQVPRMREMLPGPQTKLDKTAKLGKHQVPAHKMIGLIEIPTQPPEWLQVWTVWTVLFDRVFSITFTVKRADVGKWKDFVARISRGLEFSRPVPNQARLTPYSIKEPAFSFVRPADWVVDTSKSARGALAIFNHSFAVSGADQKEIQGKQSISVTMRKNVAGDSLESRLEQAKQDICSSLDLKNYDSRSIVLADGETKALVLEYQSDAVEKGGRYRQVLITNSHVSNAPVIIFTMQSNVELNELTSTLFDAVQNSISFAKSAAGDESHPPKLSCVWMHTKYGFGLQYDDDVWTCPPDVALPKTELFLVGKGSRDAPPTFTVLVRQYEKGEPITLDIIVEGILNDLQQMCDEHFSVTSRDEDVTVAALPQKAVRVLTKGASRNPAGQIVEVRNAHTVFCAEERNLVCVMAFSATPDKWEALWPSAQKIINSFSISSSRKQ